MSPQTIGTTVAEIAGVDLFRHRIFLQNVGKTTIYVKKQPLHGPVIDPSDTNYDYKLDSQGDDKQFGELSLRSVAAFRAISDKKDGELAVFSSRYVRSAI